MEVLSLRGVNVRIVVNDRNVTFVVAHRSAIPVAFLETTRTSFLPVAGRGCPERGCKSRPWSDGNVAPVVHGDGDVPSLDLLKRRQLTDIVRQRHQLGPNEWCTSQCTESEPTKNDIHRINL